MFQTVDYQIYSEKIKSPVTIVMLADLHNHLYGEENQMLLGEIRRISPDFVCIAGDMLIGNPKISYETAQKTVMALTKEYPVFYGLGNHESRMLHDRDIYGTLYEEYMEPLKALGVKVLVNENAYFQVRESQFQIFGYDLPMKYFEKFNRYPFESSQVEEVLGVCDSAKEQFRILLAHNPVYFSQYAEWGADLTLSGHLHGGIIRLPLIGGIITPQAKLFPKYSAGNYKIQEKNIIVSRGLGTHTISIRFRNQPELSAIYLEPMEKCGNKK